MWCTPFEQRRIDLLIAAARGAIARPGDADAWGRLVAQVRDTGEICWHSAVIEIKPKPDDGFVGSPDVEDP